MSTTNEVEYRESNSLLDKTNTADNHRKRSTSTPKKFTFSLVFCCFTVGLCSFQFGFNLGSLSPNKEVLEQFIFNKTFLFKPFHEGLVKFTSSEAKIIEAENNLNLKRQELEDTQARYLDCVMSFDFECQDEIKLRSKEKEK